MLYAHCQLVHLIHNSYYFNNSDTTTKDWIRFKPMKDWSLFYWLWIEWNLNRRSFAVALSSNSLLSCNWRHEWIEVLCKKNWITDRENVFLNSNFHQRNILMIYLKAQLFWAGSFGLILFYICQSTMKCTQHLNLNLVFVKLTK